MYEHKNVILIWDIVDFKKFCDKTFFFFLDIVRFKS